MSGKHPIVTVTGSSGAGTSFVKKAVEKIFAEQNLNAAIIEGDSFHKYNRAEMREKVAESKNVACGRVLTHFSEHANEFQKLEALFKQYKETGTGQRRYYIHSEEEAAELNARLGTNLQPGEFTPWEPIPEGTDVLFYEGLHGMVKRMDTGPVESRYDVSQYVDLGIGVCPVINIEWMQKIYRDTTERPYCVGQVCDIILERMQDYIQYIVPQFHRTHINFHRVPLVDTSDPFSTLQDEAALVPEPKNSLMVTHVRHAEVDLECVKDMIPGAWLQTPDTLVYNSEHMVLAMDILMSPIIKNLIAKKNS